MANVLKLSVLIFLQLEPVKTGNIVSSKKLNSVLLNFSVDLYCPQKLQGVFNKTECARQCYRRNYCSAVQYATSNCTIWKHVTFQPNSSIQGDLYIKDSTGSFKSYDCDDHYAAHRLIIGKCF